MKRFKKTIAVAAAVLMLTGSLSSCQRQGCPNNFSLTDVAHELVQKIIH
ncbi:MAG: hypothetical protein R2753_13655 [Chitinophagales bacterium]